MSNPEVEQLSEIMAHYYVVMTASQLQYPTSIGPPVEGISIGGTGFYCTQCLHGFNASRSLTSH